jgi:hypothetical protein
MAEEVEVKVDGERDNLNSDLKMKKSRLFFRVRRKTG